MSDRVMRALVDKLRGRHVGTITLGGGENTIVPKLVSKFWNMLTNAGVYPAQFVVITNGKAMPRAFMNAIAKIQRHAEVTLMASFDNCHDHVDHDEFYERREQLRKVTAQADRFHSGVMAQFRYGGEGIATPYGDDLIRTHKHSYRSVLKMGRGATHYGGEAAVTINPFILRDDDPEMLPLCEDDIYVDAHGNVWPHCDLSYEFMRRRTRFRLGSVLDPGFDWLLAALRFNMKFADQFPLKVVEPDFEGGQICNPESPFGMGYVQDRLEETAAMAKKLNILKVR